MVVFVFAVVAVAAYVVVVVDHVVVRVVIGRRVVVNLRIAVFVRGFRDLREVPQAHAGRQRIIYRKENIHLYRCARRKAARCQFVALVQYATYRAADQHPTFVVVACNTAFVAHARGHVVAHFYVVGGYLALVDHANHVVDRVARFYRGALARRQQLDRGKVKTLYHHRGGVMVVFVAAIVAIAIYFIICQIVIIIGIVVRR